MSAERLREAAGVLRQRAEAACAGPWETFAAYGGRSGALELHGVRSVPIEATGEFDSEVSQSIDEADAAYIATMSPPVALALADWLETTAERIDAGRDPLAGGRRNHGWRGSKQALAVADAILGAP